MKTQYGAISEAFNELGGEREIREISTWVIRKYGDKWKDFSTPMADMVPVRLGGNKTSSVPDRYRVLERVARGRYRLAVNDDTKKGEREQR